MLKTHLRQVIDLATKQVPASRQQMRRRQLIRIVFIVALVLVASRVSSAQGLASECCSSDAGAPMQYDGATEIVSIPVAANTGGALPQRRLMGDARPAYVDLVASLANFDADADPDGWRAEVVLRDRKDRPVVMRANATFELVPRVGTVEQVQFVNADTPPIRWSMPLEFDEDSVANVKLPLRESLKPMFGWRSALRSRNRGARLDYDRRLARVGKRSFTTLRTRDVIATPTAGQLRVRVSVPTEGVFEAVVPVWIRPSVLVDTNWPYR